MSIVDAGAIGDQALQGVKSFAAVIDKVNLESASFKTDLGGIDLLVACSLGVRMICKGSQLGIGLYQGGKGVVDVSVLGVGSHFVISECVS